MEYGIWEMLLELEKIAGGALHILMWILGTIIVVSLAFDRAEQLLLLIS